MKPFDFCPACGTRFEEGAPDGGRQCSSCGRSWYLNPAPTAAGVLVRDGKALLAVRGQEPDKGRLDVPGGFVEIDESPVEAVRREMREELGIEVEVREDDYVQSAAHQYGEEGDWLLSMGFRVRLLSGDIAPADDVADVRWVSREELDDLDFAWPHDRELVRKVLDYV
ncbi:NUDIX domain-containing protein [soil metagenome]